MIYKKGLREKVDVVSPKVYGGMKSDEYLALNPQGLIPMLVLPDGQNLWESDVSISVRSAPQFMKDRQYTRQAPELAEVHDIRTVPVCRSLPLICVTSIEAKAPLLSCPHQKIVLMTSSQGESTTST